MKDYAFYFGLALIALGLFALIFGIVIYMPWSALLLDFLALPLDQQAVIVGGILLGAGIGVLATTSN